MTVAGSGPGPAAAGGPRLGSIDALQGLRAIAAVVVVVDHALIAAAQAGLMAPAIAPVAAHLGYIAVYVFFTMSGFVMVLSHERDFGRRGAPGAFLARRIARIAPLHWITTSAMVLARPEWVAPGSLLLSLLLIPHQGPDGPFGAPLFTPAWPLQYEMAFYLLFAGALLLPRLPALALLAASLAVAVAASSLGVFGRQNALAYLTEPVLLYFAGGLALGVLRGKLPEALRPTFAAALLIAGGALAACGLGALLWGTSALRVLLLTAAGPLVAVAACGFTRPGGPATPARRASRSIGDATYSIYMVHPFLVFPMGAYLARNSLSLPWPLFVLLATAASVVAGMLSYRLIERRLVTAFSRLIGGRPG